MGGGCCVANCCVMNNSVGDFFRDIFCSDTGCGYHPGPSETEKHAREINARIQEVEKVLAETERAYSKILQAKKTGDVELEKQQIEHMYCCELYSLFLGQMEEH